MFKEECAKPRAGWLRTGFNLMIKKRVCEQQIPEPEHFSRALQYLWGGPPKHSIQLLLVHAPLSTIRTYLWHHHSLALRQLPRWEVRLPACHPRTTDTSLPSSLTSAWNVPSQSFPAERTLWSLLSILNTERTCVCARIKLKVHNYLHSATGVCGEPVKAQCGYARQTMCEGKHDRVVDGRGWEGEGQVGFQCSWLVCLFI